MPWWTRSDQRPQRLLDVGVEVGPVDLVQVDVVGLSRRRLLSTSRMIHSRELPAFVGCRCPSGRAPWWPGRPGRGGPRSALPTISSEPSLGVDVGGVDEVDPAVERGVDDPHALVLVRVAPGPEHHGAQAERADPDSGPSERSIFHADSFQVVPWPTGPPAVLAEEDRRAVHQVRGDDGDDVARGSSASPSPGAGSRSFPSAASAGTGCRSGPAARCGPGPGQRAPPEGDDRGPGQEARGPAGDQAERGQHRRLVARDHRPLRTVERAASSCRPTESPGRSGTSLTYRIIATSRPTGTDA